jgi:hypothetical protein
MDTTRAILVSMTDRLGGITPHEMGTFRVDVEIENPAQPGTTRELTGVRVDTGAELSWVPAEVLEALGVGRNNRWRFRQADGTVLERWTGSVLVRVLGKHAVARCTHPSGLQRPAPCVSEA